MNSMHLTDGVQSGETPESILAGIRELSGEIALQDFHERVDQDLASQEAKLAGVVPPYWETLDSLAESYSRGGHTEWGAGATGLHEPRNHEDLLRTDRWQDHADIRTLGDRPIALGRGGSDTASSRSSSQTEMQHFTASLLNSLPDWWWRIWGHLMITWGGDAGVPDIPREPDWSGGQVRHHCDHWNEPSFSTSELYADTLFCFLGNGWSEYPSNSCFLCAERLPCNYPVLTPGFQWFQWADPIEGTIIPPGEVAAYLKPYQPDLPDLIESAWALLMRNFDVVEYLACKISHYNALAPPAPYLADFFREAIFSGSSRVAISPMSGVELIAGNWGGAWAFTDSFVSTTIPRDGYDPRVGVVIPANQSGWLTRELRYKLGRAVPSSGSLSPSEKSDRDNGMCAIVDAAAVILHELMHEASERWVWEDGAVTFMNNGTMQTVSYGQEFADDRALSPPGCNKAQSMIFFSFHVVMRERISCLADSFCCSQLGSRDSWMSGHARGNTWIRIC